MKRIVLGMLVLGLVSVMAGCGAGPGGGPTGGANGRLSFKLNATIPTHDVASVHIKVVGVNDDCSAAPIKDALEPLETEPLPAAQLPPGAGPLHPFGDALFVLPAGDYKVCMIPLDAAGDPSLDCGTVEQAPVTVIAEMTTEVVLISQCTGNPNGGLDVIGTLNDSPVITDLVIAPSKFIDACESAAITVTASDANGDALTYTWSVISGPAPGTITGAGATVTFSTEVPGDYELKVVVTDGVGGMVSLTFPVHVSACVCAEGLSLCGRVCVDLASDAANCGACGIVCAEGTCSAGACLLP